METTKSPLLKLAKEEKEKMKLSSAISKVRFIGWKTTDLMGWQTWVQNMCSVHRSTWKSAGVYQAIMSSKYMFKIKRDNNLILELASRWCSQSNTFAFPWGEATLTLEDMLVLGGFSSSGVSALSSLENDPELLKIKEQLDLARIEILRSRSKAAVQSKWIEKFIKCGSDLEHAAFLSLWLSRYVFPLIASNTVINKNVFPIAARLSRGIKIALGPVVLAMLYRDLSTLGKRLHFAQLVACSEDNVGKTDLCSLFHLVQIWAWERFPQLKPVPNSIYFSEKFPRLARWSNVKISKDKDLERAINAVEKAFLWLPYEGRDLESFGHCMETIELVGFDSCIEKYHPQRVARQFGLDDNATDYVPTGFTPQIEVINVVDSDSESESNDNVLNGSVPETMEDEGDVADNAKHREIEDEQSELATSCDAGSYTNERSKGSGLDLEARISRLEDIVYVRIKALQSTRQH